MSIENAKEVVRLATVSVTFRTAFRANPSQALTLFAADLTLSGGTVLSKAEMEGIASITDEEYKAFARIVSAVGASLDTSVSPPVVIGIF